MKGSKEDKISILRLTIISLFGVSLSVLFIFLYYKFNNTIMTILTLLLSLVFMIGTILFINKKENIFVNIKKAVVFFPLIYTTIVFAFLLFIEQKRIFENASKILDCLIWAVYTMPSFMIVILIVMLLLLMLGYAG